MDIRWISSAAVQTVGPERLPELLGRSDGVLWADLHHTDDASMTVLADLGFHHLALDECRARTPVPKMHLYGDHLFLALNGLTRGIDTGLHFLPVKAFVNPTTLVTVHGPVHPAVSPEVNEAYTATVRARIDDGRYLPQSAAQLTHDIVIGVVRTVENLVGELATRTTDLERKVKIVDPIRMESLLGDLFDLRHDLQTIRTSAAQSREVFLRILDSGRLPPDSAPYVEDLSHEFDHLTNLSDLEREYLQELLDLFQTRISSELNVFVRKLTSWGAIGIAGTLIAGIYGMNFEHMPELGWQYGYPLSIGSMVVVGLILGAIFRRRGWL